MAPRRVPIIGFKASDLAEADPWMNVNRKKALSFVHFHCLVLFPTNTLTFLSADTGFWLMSSNTKPGSSELKATPERTL